jgi:hypothetical protein
MENRKAVPLRWRGFLFLEPPSRVAQFQRFNPQPLMMGAG